MANSSGLNERPSRTSLRGSATLYQGSSAIACVAPRWFPVRRLTCSTVHDTSGYAIRIRLPRIVIRACRSSASRCSRITSFTSMMRCLTGRSGSRITPAWWARPTRTSLPKSLSSVIRILPSALARSSRAASPGSASSSLASKTSWPSLRNHSASRRPAQQSMRKPHGVFTETAASVSPAITACAYAIHARMSSFSSFG